MVAAVRRVGEQHVVRRHAVLFDDFVEVLVFVVHVREPQAREVLRNGALAEVRVVDAELLLGLPQRERDAKQKGLDVLVRRERRLAVVRGVHLERVVAALHGGGRLGSQREVLHEPLLTLSLVLLAFLLSSSSLRGGRDDRRRRRIPVIPNALSGWRSRGDDVPGRRARAVAGVAHRVVDPGANHAARTAHRVAIPGVRARPSRMARGASRPKKKALEEKPARAPSLTTDHVVRRR